METAHFEPDRCRPETGFQQQTCALRAQTCGWLRALPWLLRPPVGLSSTLTGLSKSRRFHFSSWMAWDKSMIKFSTRRWEVVSERGILALKKTQTSGHGYLRMWCCNCLVIMRRTNEDVGGWNDPGSRTLLLNHWINQFWNWSSSGLWRYSKISCLRV